MTYLKLVSWLNAAGVKDRFVLLGERSDIPDCLLAMDLFCLHSRTEGFSNALSEAMAMARPCIATDVGDSKLLLGNTGFLVQKNNPKALAHGIAKILRCSKEYQKQMGLKAQKRVESEFSLVKSCRKYETVYAELLAGEYL